MSDTLKQVNVKTQAGATIHRLNEHGKANALKFSKDFSIQHNIHGTTIGINPRIKHSFDGMVYFGELDPTASYDRQSVVRVLPSGSYSISGSAISPSPGTWVCVVPVPAFGYTSSQQNEVRQAGIPYYPVFPESSSLANPWATDSTANGRYWEKFGGDSGGNVSTKTLSLIFDNYVVCTDGTRVAKPPRCRNSISGEIIYGNTFTMTYPHNTDNSGAGNDASTSHKQYVYRTVTASGIGENQGYVPPYIANESILCMPCTTGVTTITQDSGSTAGTPVTYVEMGERKWSKFADQTF